MHIVWKYSLWCFFICRLNLLRWLKELNLLMPSRCHPQVVDMSISASPIASRVVAFQYSRYILLIHIHAMFFCLTSLPKFRNAKLIFFLHSSYTKISLCMQSGQYKPVLPPLLPSRCEACGNMFGPCVAPEELQAVAYLGLSCAFRQVWILSGLDLLAGKCSRSVISILPAVILPLYQFSHAGCSLYSSLNH